MKTLAEAAAHTRCTTGLEEMRGWAMDICESKDCMDLIKSLAINLSHEMLGFLKEARTEEPDLNQLAEDTSLKMLSKLVTAMSAGVQIGITMERSMHEVGEPK